MSAVRFNPETDHYIRHNPGEPDTEYNKPESVELSDKDFVAHAMESGMIQKKGKKYFHNEVEVGSKQSDVVAYIQDNPVLMDEFSAYIFKED